MSNPRIRDWQGRRVWILGASGGIGAALARELAGRGARVAVSARRGEALAALAGELPGALPWPCDAADPGSVRVAAAAIAAAWGGIDLAIYNAGVWHPSRADRLEAAAIDATVDINLRAPMHFAAAVLPHLAPGGSLAFVGSVSAYRALPRAALYGASKAGLAYFAAALHLELAPRGIGVFLISPGFVDTPMTQVNRFAMPGLMSAAAAARAIAAGFARGAFEIHFPRRLSWPLRWMRLLPDAAYFPLVRRLLGVPP